MIRVILVLLLFMPCMAQAAGIEVVNARVRMPPPVSDTAAVYMDIRNTDKQAHQLVGIMTDVADMTMFHGKDMQPLHGIRIEPGAHYEFAPGGAHIMLMGLKRVLHAGDRVSLILQLADDGQRLKIQAVVQDMR